MRLSYVQGERGDAGFMAGVEAALQGVCAGQRQKDHSATLHILVLSVKAASIGEESWVGEDTGLREAEGNLEEGKQCSVLVPPLLLMSHKSGICFSNQTELKYKPNNRTIG